MRRLPASLCRTLTAMSPRPLLIALLVVSSSVPSRRAEAATSPDAAAEFLRVVSGAPALQAAARRIDAAQQRTGAAGLLPDPEVEGMVSRMNGAMGERSDMYEVSVRQPLPRRGELSAQRERARAAVAMAEADYALMAGELAAETAMALAEAEGATARLACVRRQVDRLDAVLRSLDTRLATSTGGMGGVRLADRLTVQTRLAAMRLMLENDQRMADDAAAEARGRLGLSPDQALPAFVAPLPADIDPAAAPALLAASARTAEADAMAGMAKAAARPMTAVGLRYERERNSMGNENTVGVALMSDFPWRSRRASRAELEAASAERAAAQAEATSATYRIRSAVTRAERAVRLAESSRRVSHETLARLEAELDAFLRAASAGSPGESTVLMTVELLEKATEAEIQVIAAEQAERTARAELWRYVSAARFPPPAR